MKEGNKGDGGMMVGRDDDAQVEQRLNLLERMMELMIVREAAEALYGAVLSGVNASPPASWSFESSHLSGP